MDEELKWFASADLNKYAGKYIAIIGKKIVASGNNAKEVWNAAKAAFPDKTPTLAKIPKEDLLILGAAYGN